MTTVSAWCLTGLLCALSALHAPAQELPSEFQKPWAWHDQDSYSCFSIDFQDANAPGDTTELCANDNNPSFNVGCVPNTEIQEIKTLNDSGNIWYQVLQNIPGIGSWCISIEDTTSPEFKLSESSCPDSISSTKGTLTEDGEKCHITIPTETRKQWRWEDVLTCLSVDLTGVANINNDKAMVCANNYPSDVGQINTGCVDGTIKSITRTDTRFTVTFEKEHTDPSSWCIFIYTSESNGNVQLALGAQGSCYSYESVDPIRIRNVEEGSKCGAFPTLSSISMITLIALGVQFFLSFGRNV